MMLSLLRVQGSLCKLRRLSHPLATQQLASCLLSPRTFSSRGDARQKDTILTVEELRALSNDLVGRTDDLTGKIVNPQPGVMQEVVTTQDQLPRRRPSDSFARAVVPLGTDENLRDKYITHFKLIRFGRILEDFDSLAGFLCYKHNHDPKLPANQKSPYAYVTAIVDRIEIEPSLPPLSAYKDIFLDGKVTWVGRTSMECTMKLQQEIDGKMREVIEARYLFVSRNPITKKAAVVCPLDPETEEDEELMRQGEERRARRKERAKQSVLKLPPSKEEGMLIHDIFLSTLDTRLHTRVRPKNKVWMKDTVLKTLLICQPEERNIYNKIFGGFLMRQAFELASNTAALHSKSRYPKYKVVDDIVFRKPVDIGSVLFLSSQIVYSQGGDVRIRVNAEVADPVTGSRQSTNDFNFTFDCGKSDMKQVIPKSYAESMLYVDGKRGYEANWLRTEKRCREPKGRREHKQEHSTVFSSHTQR